jgi:hypothetical protein
MHVVIIKSSNPNKKFSVIINGRKTIHFGAAGYQDFTQHHDIERKRRYISRHLARENWSDPFTAGFWSGNLLWNKPTIEASARDIARRFNINIRLAV